MSVTAGLKPLADAVAVIDEQRCIGCTLCIAACPVDAIVGAAKLMHTVIAAACTGCELCVPPCPVDCIAILPIEVRSVEARAAASAEAHRRHAARGARLARMEREKTTRAVKHEDVAARRKRETIAKAMARARERLESRKANR